MLDSPKEEKQASGNADKKDSDWLLAGREVTNKLPRVVKQPNDYVKMVDNWLEKEEDYRMEAAHASFVMLMSDFLFSRRRLPVKWLDWVFSLDMIWLKNDADGATNDDLQKEDLDEHLIIVVKMLLKVQSEMKILSKSRYNLIGLLEFMNQVDAYKSTNMSRVINVARGQEQIKKLCDSLDISGKYSPNDKDDKQIDMNFHEFADSYERKVLAALLVGRSLANTIKQSLCDEYDIVAQANELYQDSEEALKFKAVGNEQFTSREYDKALETYSKAISLSKYSAVLYSNRCQTALKLKVFRLAISDGYRATALKPNWGKAYYRQAEALRGDNQLDAALDCNKLGLQLCEAIAEKQDLRKQQKRLEVIRFGEDEVSVGNKKSKRPKKSKKKSGNFAEEQVPPLVSDDDSMRSMSDNELSVAKYFKRVSSGPPKPVKPKKQKQDINEEKKPKPPVEKPQVAEPPVTYETTSYEEGKAQAFRHAFDLTSQFQKVHLMEEEYEQARNAAKKINAANDAKSSEAYKQHRSSGSKALMAKNHVTAAREFESAITCLEHATSVENFAVPYLERFVLIYARGYVSLEMVTPIEKARSLFYFDLITNRKKLDDEAPHPLPYYSIAHAHYQLNNFLMVSKPLLNGMKLLETTRIKYLTWPGTGEVIPDSRIEKLRKLMHDLLRMSQYPPKPDAVCFYSKCEKDEKNESRYYAMCDKDIFRKEIFNTDLNFEGFIKIFCSWSCVTCFHYKCWSRFKQSVYGKAGDKEIRDRPCFTDGCKGSISRIIMIDENQKVKKDIRSEKSVIKEKEENKKEKYSFRMSKSERNMSRRRKKLEQAKNRKSLYKQNTNETNLTNKQSEKNVKKKKVFTEKDLANATIIKREDHDDTKLPKTKHKTKPKKKPTNTVTLQEFLGDVTSDELNMADVEKAIASRSAETPFQVPESLRDEIVQFENDYSDEDLIRITILYEYFEKFFEYNGPVKVSDDLLLQQQVLLPDPMKKLINKSKNVVAFLCNSKDRFMIKVPYIGLPKHQALIAQLVHEYKKEVSVKDTSKKRKDENARSSVLDTLDSNFDSPSVLSDFARDVYAQGVVPLSDIQNITGHCSSSLDTPTTSAMLTNGFKRTWDQSSNSSTDKASCSQQADLRRKSSNASLDSFHRGDGDTIVTPNVKLATKMDLFLQISDEADKKSDNSTTYPAKDAESVVSSQGQQASGDGDEDIFVLDESEEDSEEEVLTSTSATQTELLPSYEQEIAKLVQEKELLEIRLEEINDRHHRLGVKSRTDQVALQKEVSEVKESLQSTRKKALAAAQHFDGEIKKMTKDRTSCLESAKAIKLQLNEVQSREAELLQRIKDKEADVDQLSRVLQDQRSTWLEEKLTGERERDQLKEELHQANNRAMESELKSLQVQENFGLKVLVTARGECERITAEFGKLGRHYSNNSSARREVLIGFSKWKSNIETCTHLIDHIKQQFAAHSEHVRRGKRLSELASIAIPNPPSPGPSLQHVAAAVMRIPNRGGPALSMSAVQLNATNPPSPPMLSNGNNDSVTQITPSRYPQPPIGTAKQPIPMPKNHNNNTATPPPPPPANESSSSNQSKGSFEKIMVQLQGLFPNVSRAELALCIKEVRQNNNYSLTGLSLEDIVKQASRAISKKGHSRTSMTSVSPNAPSPPTLSTAARSSTSSSVAPWFQGRPPQARAPMAISDDEPCVICHDPLMSMEVHKLQCGHVFHKECLAKWLERNRTCPTCRDYAIDTSEYPALTNMVRR